MSALGDHFRGGSGEPLLLVHGFSATWRTWRPVPEILAGEYDVLAPTLPGHCGGPDVTGSATVDHLVDDVERMLDEVGWSAPAVAGFSMGGWIALELAKRGRAKRVVAIAPAGAVGERTNPREARRIQLQFKISRAAARSTLPYAESLARRPRFRRLAMLEVNEHGERLGPDEVVRSIRDHAATPVFDELLKNLVRGDGLTGLDRVTVPVHLVWGRHDKVLPISHAEYFRRHLPHATWQELDHSGHVPFPDEPEAILQAIRTGSPPEPGGSPVAERDPATAE
jgi:pimeloyl-ACP methyl ester carboxylesterase